MKNFCCNKRFIFYHAASNDISIQIYTFNLPSRINYTLYKCIFVHDIIADVTILILTIFSNTWLKKLPWFIYNYDINIYKTNIGLIKNHTKAGAKNYFQNLNLKKSKYNMALLFKIISSANVQINKIICFT